jgi:hypothetical protein
MAAKKFTDDEQTFIGVLKALNSEAGAAKFAKSSKAKSSDGDAGASISRPSSPVKGAKGVSKGGQISKKEREVMSMAKGVVEGKKEEAD